MLITAPAKLLYLKIASGIFKGFEMHTKLIKEFLAAAININKDK
jgi:hypothetical protein